MHKMASADIMYSRVAGVHKDTDITVHTTQQLASGAMEYGI